MFSPVVRQRYVLAGIFKLDLIVKSTLGSSYNVDCKLLLKPVLSEWGGARFSCVKFSTNNQVNSEIICVTRRFARVL